MDSFRYGLLIGKVFMNDDTNHFRDTGNETNLGPIRYLFSASKMMMGNS